MNRITLTGRLTKDGEVRTTKDDIKLYSNTIAVNRKFKNVDGKYDADFFNFTLWNVTDNFAQYLTKGKLILLEGRIQNRTYENEKQEKRHITEVIAEHIELLSSEKKEEKEENTQQEVEVPSNYKTEYDNENSVHVDDDDLPF